VKSLAVGREISHKPGSSNDEDNIAELSVGAG